jgi:hypothetical protein
MRVAKGPFDLTLARFGQQSQVVGLQRPLSTDWLGHCADFHLPTRREGWIRQLRRARFGRMRQMLPATLRSPAEHPELPPGTVLQGLGISGWDRLIELRGQGRSFCLRMPGKPLVWLTDECRPAHWSKAQHTLLQPGCLITELPGVQADSLWRLHYASDAAGYISLRSCTQLPQRSLPEWAAGRQAVASHCAG